MPLPNVRQILELAPGKTAEILSLPLLEKAGFGAISRLPVSLRIILESLVRNCDEKRVRTQDVANLAAWKAQAPRTEEVPFVVARVLLQDFTGVPLLVDLAAMRAAVQRLGREPSIIEPRVPVDLVIDHSVQVDFFGRADALEKNLAIELRRNAPRYEFLKWGAQAFHGLRIVPPGFGICHQVNLEYLSQGVLERGGLAFPDTLVGTDSHTTMVNGLGIVGWGVGGIEAEAAMLDQPVYFLMPDVVGVELRGALPQGVTATDLVLAVTERLRRAGVVGKIVEYFGAGAAALPVPERATIANMAPEYGATMGYFPVDAATCSYLETTGRTPEQVRTVERYFRAQGMFGIPRAGECDYSTVIEIDLDAIEPCVAGPKRPQDRVPLVSLRSAWKAILQAPAPAGYGKPEAEHELRFATGDGASPLSVTGGGEMRPESAPMRSRDTNPATELEMMNNRPTPNRLAASAASGPARDEGRIGHGSVVIAAITSCTNTSNPSVMLGAGILAKKAVEKGLRVKAGVKSSLAPGSRVVSAYLEQAGLQRYLDALGFHTVGYGCTTCIGNSGPLDPGVERAIARHDLIVASVLSGNRNFEARVHQSVKANFLMSPPLVVAFALSGRIDVDFEREPIGRGTDGREVYLRDLWPTLEEIRAAHGFAAQSATYRQLYAQLEGGAEWQSIESPRGMVYVWDEQSTYIREPPYFRMEGERFHSAPSASTPIRRARALAIFGDSITTDHISPAGAIRPASPAAQYLEAQGVARTDFNSYGARRGNHEVMLRGTFANVRIRNLMVPGSEGGITAHQPSGQKLSIFDAAARYAEERVPLVVLAGKEYGSGSSRDWAAKGTRLLGVRAVLAQSFERIHRSNLVGMGVLPCQFERGESAQTLHLDGSETFDLLGTEGALSPRMQLVLAIHRAAGTIDEVPVTLRIDTPIEIEYYRHGGILPYVLRELLAS